jgi:phosphatidylinositol 4-kinase type 2
MNAGGAGKSRADPENCSIQGNGFDGNCFNINQNAVEVLLSGSQELPIPPIMPKNRPAASGYARLAQADEDERGHPFLDESDDDDPYTTPAILSTSTQRYAPIQPQPHVGMEASGHSSPTGQRKRPNTGRRRMRSNSSGIDIKAINARLERWADEIASKFKISKVKGKTQEEEKLEIHHTVFQPPEGVRPATAETLASESNEERMTKAQFEDIVESVRVAIEVGVHPKMISQGSSGSYFARNSDGKVVGVFKPKDEEPYASRNPKWTKWIHRNLFPCFFGRACLIPNLSYVSEAAAYVLDTRLRTNLVPYTDIVYLSSKSFYYDFWDRRSYWRGKKPLPAKIGSFQVFLKGYKDANIFLREHPWPDQGNAAYSTGDAPKRKKKRWAEACRTPDGTSDDEEDYGRVITPVEEENPTRKFHWSDNLKQTFREELEKLVILDYIMRNTDRGLDNWMIKIDWQTEEVSIVSDPPKLNGNADHPQAPRPVSINSDRPHSADLNPYRRQENMVAISRTGTPSNVQDQVEPSISIGAIDNSLSWPWKHPDAVSFECGK